MTSPIVQEIGKAQLRKLPRFHVGDTVRVHVRVVEGGRTRTQAFQGTVIGRRGSGPGETFTVRRVTFGEGVERIFPANSPSIDHIEVVRYGDVRRAKLYYLRKRVGKSARIADSRARREAALAADAADAALEQDDEPAEDTAAQLAEDTEEAAPAAEQA